MTDQVQTTEKPLSAKHNEFINNLFLLKFNGTKAYAETYPDNKTPRFSASQLLTNLNIKAEIEHRTALTRQKSIKTRKQRQAFWTAMMEDPKGTSNSITFARGL
ncbi:MAG TPA: hypothetical protein ENH60_07325 [Pricia sp.]|nr:hypothetical protein [Pricia sp.]